MSNANIHYSPRQLERLRSLGGTLKDANGQYGHEVYEERSAYVAQVATFQTSVALGLRYLDNGFSIRAYGDFKRTPIVAAGRKKVADYIRKHRKDAAFLPPVGVRVEAAVKADYWKKVVENIGGAK